MQSRDSFHIEVPSPSLTAVNGTHGLKSPSALKAQRTPSFSRDGILGAAQKARNMSQSSDNRADGANGMTKTPSDEGSNPLKRRNTDAGGVDYPRRRATIAVRLGLIPGLRPSPLAARASSNLPMLTSAVVRSLQIEEISMRWHQTQVQALHRARRRLHLQRTRHQAGRG